MDRMQVVVIIAREGVLEYTNCCTNDGRTEYDKNYILYTELVLTGHDALERKILIEATGIRDTGQIRLASENYCYCV